MASFTLMCWNVENLFLPDADATDQVRERFQAKLTTLAAVIDSQQPDLLALQEVGPNGALQALQDALATPLPHTLEGEPDARGIRVAFLSRLPFTATRTIKAFPEMILPVQARDPVFDEPSTPEDESLTASMGRGALEVAIEVEGHPVRIITAHFKSKLVSYARQRGLVGGCQFAPNDENERYRYAAYGLYRRTTEAVTVRDRVNQLLFPAAGSPDPDEGLGHQKGVVVCGDLNDEPEAATTQILQGPTGSEIGTEGFKRDDKGDGYRLWNLAPILNEGPEGQPPAEAPFTRRFKGRGELIDHIFASHRLVNPGNMPVARTVMASDRLPSVTEAPSERTQDPGSDHAAVVAVFEV
jgi:endonuclease/exonuclease/phosphatase family metal-dependent hydrolase